MFSDIYITGIEFFIPDSSSSSLPLQCICIFRLYLVQVPVEHTTQSVSGNEIIDQRSNVTKNVNSEETMDIVVSSFIVETL